MAFLVLLWVVVTSASAAAFPFSFAPGFAAPGSGAPLRLRRKSQTATPAPAAQQVVYWGQMAYFVVPHREAGQVPKHKGGQIRF